ncbi:MAG: glycoside hydrolase family protein [Phenylobacterium sp.]
MSRTAIELIKRFEGYRQKAAQLPDGRWTIGHGHTKTARQGAQVSPADAEALLLYDLIAVGLALDQQVFAPLNQHQFDALASFAFNIGLDNFSRSGVLRRLNEGSAVQAASAMELWRKAEVAGERIVVDALVRRRAAERALFLTPENDAWVPAPSHVLQPLIDTDAFDLIPSQRPVSVATSLDGEWVVVTRDGEPSPPPVSPEDDETGPAKAAGEAVTARLSTIFQDAPEPSAEPAADMPTVPEEPPFALQPPDFNEAEDEEPPELEIDAHVEGAPGPDLFDAPEIAPLVEDQPNEEPLAAPEPEGPAWPGPGREAGERRIIDDAAPYEYEDAPLVQPMPEPPQGGILTLVALAVLGLVFFGGGVFWATNARPMPGQAWLDPRMVGWLAGVTGALFFAIAIYLLLQRLGQASEREARNRY